LKKILAHFYVILRPEAAGPKGHTEMYKIFEENFSTFLCDPERPSVSKGAEGPTLTPRRTKE